MLIEEITQYLKQLLETVQSLQGAVINIETHAAISNTNLKSEEEVQLSKEHFTHLSDVITDKTTKCENNLWNDLISLVTVAFVENPTSIDECKPFGLMLEQELVKLLSLASAVMLDNSKYCLSVKLSGIYLGLFLSHFLSQKNNICYPRKRCKSYWRNPKCCKERPQA